MSNAKRGGYVQSLGQSAKWVTSLIPPRNHDDECLRGQTRAKNALLAYGVVMFVGSAAVLVVAVLGMMLGAPGADGAVYVVGAAVGLLLGALVVVGVW